MEIKFIEIRRAAYRKFSFKSAPNIYGKTEKILDQKQFHFAVLELINNLIMESDYDIDKLRKLISPYEAKNGN